MTDDDLREELEALKARVRSLERKLGEDDGITTSRTKTTPTSRLDHYDEPVVETLERGEVYHVRDLTQRYLTHSKITDDDTAKERVKQLVRSNGFENRGGGRHEYTGWI